ncbi:MAG: nucleotidyltransferase [Candidatus Izemoplasma sp.]|nr:nucleotidyltransferase [Candidatus Izemoplasma sp.]
MKATGIIVEYNPLHNGHMYHLNETKKLFPDRCTIAIMSGNFTQRGEPAIVDKFARTEMAIKAGVDLVIELPFVFTVQNADIFAKTSVHLLDMLGVENIVFGSETGDMTVLEDMLKQMDSKIYHDRVKYFLKQGNSYPTASALAMAEQGIDKGFDAPNNILGLQYLKAKKALNSKITFHTIRRQTTGYYDKIKQNASIQSATAIRGLIKNNESYERYVPKPVKSILDSHKSIDYNFFTDHFKYLINVIPVEDIGNLFNMTEGIEHRIKKMRHFSTTSELIEQLITRRYTYSSIKRTLAHLLCQTKETLIESFIPPYLRVLGMNKVGKEYLSQIKHDLEIPLITNVKEGIHPYLDHELKVSRIYSLASDKDVFKMEFDPTINLYIN